MYKEHWHKAVLVLLLVALVSACAGQASPDTAHLEAAESVEATAEAKVVAAEAALATAESKAAAAQEAGAEELATAQAETAGALAEAEAAKAAAEAAKNDSQSTAAQGPTTLKIWSNNDEWVESLDYYAENVKEFAEEHPDVTVEYVHIPYENYEAKYLTAFAGRTEAPDIFIGKAAYYAGAIGVADVMPDDLQELYSQNVVEVIQPFYQVGNEWVAYPISADLGMMMYYNVDQFAEVGLDPDKPPRTFDELLDYAQKLVLYDGNGNITRNGLALRYDGAATGLTDKALPFIHGFGGRLYAPDGSTAQGYLNGPETVAALQYMYDLVYRHKVASLELGKPVDTFAAGKSAIIFRESWLVGWMADSAPTINYAVAPLPEGPAGYPGLSLLFSWSWMVNKFSPQKEIALDWIRAVSNPETDMDLAKLEGYNPVWRANFEDPYMSERPDHAAVETILSHPAGPYYDHPYINEISARIGEAVQAVLFGEAPQEALDAAAADVDVLLAKEP